jgi:hypothetical protein
MGVDLIGALDHSYYEKRNSTAILFVESGSSRKSI